MFNGIHIIISYGVGAIFGPFIVNIVDIIAIITDEYLPLHLMLMMIFRTMIIYQFKLKKKHIFLGVFLICLTIVPQVVSFS